MFKIGSQTAKGSIINIGSDINVNLEGKESLYNLTILNVSKKQINEIQNHLKDMSLTYELK